jgi:hypothetical protein
VSTKSTPQEAAAYVLRFMDSNDKIAVIEANGAIVSTRDRPPIDAINAVWISA